MTVKILIVAVVAAIMVAESSAGLMDKFADNPMVSAMLPPGCKDAVNEVAEKAKKVYEYIMREECGKLCGGVNVKASTLWPHEAKILDVAKGVFARLKTWQPTPLDIDKICPDNIKYAEIWELYKVVKAKCIVATKEFDNHPNLCKAKKEDFPKTQKCVEDFAMGEFKKRTSPPHPFPMGCASEALQKYCTKTYIDPHADYYFNQLRKDYKLEKGHNAWQMKEEYFAGKCTGKLVPKG